MSRKSKAKASQVTRLSVVLGRLYEASKNFEEEEAEAWTDEIEALLNKVASEDGFGTEGQSDPRGDFRNGEWTMRRVEGLDK